jgi:hypothetical protein
VPNVDYGWKADTRPRSLIEHSVLQVLLARTLNDLIPAGSTLYVTS